MSGYADDEEIAALGLGGEALLGHAVHNSWPRSRVVVDAAARQLVVDDGGDVAAEPVEVGRGVVGPDESGRTAKRR